MHAFTHRRQNSLRGIQKLRLLTQKRERAPLRISRRNNHSPKEGEFSVHDVSTHGESLWSQPYYSVKNQLSLRGSLVGVPFYSLDGSDQWSFTVSGPEVSLSRGMSLARTLPADQGILPFPFPPWGEVAWLGSWYPRGAVVGNQPEVCMWPLPRQSARGTKIRARRSQRLHVEKPWSLPGWVHLPQCTSSNCTST